MVEIVGQEAGTFCDSKVLGNVLVAHFKDNVCMTDRVIFVFVNKRIQGGEVVVINFFASLGLMIKLDGIGSPTAESITGVEWSNNVKFVDKFTHRWILLLEF